MCSVLLESSVDAACDLAHAWGLEDALEGLRPRAAHYFCLDTPRWSAYAEGYQAGVELLFRLTGSRSAQQVGIVTERPQDFLVDEEAPVGSRAVNADAKPVLPFTVWIVAVDLLCLEAWQVDAYSAGPQPWYAWHIDGWTPERAVMELSTPTTLPDIEDTVWTLDRPTVTVKSTFKKRISASRCAQNRRIMHDENALLTLSDDLPPGEIIEIALRYLDIQNPHQFPPPRREDKIRTLARLNIPVAPEQHPLTAWVFAMCRENGLPEQRPSIPNECAPPRSGALSIGEAAQELCPNWVWWLA